VEQINAEKPGGGWRPLCMEETTLKVMDAVPVKRKAQARRTMALGQVYSQSNLSGEIGFEAATEVLYLNTLVMEDA